MTVLNSTELFTLQWLNFFYVNFISIHYKSYQRSVNSRAVERVVCVKADGL